MPAGAVSLAGLSTPAFAVWRGLPASRPASRPFTPSENARRYGFLGHSPQIMAPKRFLAATFIPIPHRSRNCCRVALWLVNERLICYVFAGRT